MICLLPIHIVFSRDEHPRKGAIQRIRPIPGDNNASGALFCQTSMIESECWLLVSPTRIIQEENASIFHFLPLPNTTHLAPFVFKCLREFLEHSVHHGEGGELGDLNPLNQSFHFRLVQGVSLCPLRDKMANQEERPKGLTRRGALRG